MVELNPRYGDDPIIRIIGFDDDPLALMIQQRARLAETLATLDDEQWATASRCDGWTAQDVVTHLVSTNGFWAASIALGLAGKPSRFLAGFDPVASPAQMVAAAGVVPPAETLASFVASNAALAEAAARVGDQTWTTVAETPAGHLAMGCVALHALWDALLHERDILLPLGVPVVEEPAEIGAALTYAAALGPAYAASLGSGRIGAIEIRTTSPDVHLGVELLADSVVVRSDESAAGAVVLEGDSLETLEALSCRAPLSSTIAPRDRWLFEGLAIAFDQTT